MTEHAEKLWTEMRKFKTCMLVTKSQDGLRARPMAPLHDEQAGVIRFITDRRDYKDNEVAQWPEVCISYSDAHSNTYVSITGTARLETRREIIREHWSDGADAWFKDGADSANAIMLEVAPQRGEYWDGPASNVMVALESLRAKATGDRPDLGENEKVAL